MNKSLGVLLRSFNQTVRRFPMPLLCSVLGFLFLLFEIHGLYKVQGSLPDYLMVRLFLEATMGISCFTACDIFTESQKAHYSVRIGLYLLTFCILGLHFYSITPGMFDSETIFVSHYLIFWVCFHLLISFVSFYKASQVDSFWQYNYFLFKRLLTSFLYATTLFIGLGSALLALDKLFELKLNPDIYTDLGAFIYLIFHTVFFLMGMPSDYQEFTRTNSFRKGVRIFVQYVLLPIVAMYLIILYLYLAKVIITREIPSGWTCIPVLIFSIIGILAYLLVYPIRLNNSHRIIYWFSRYFFYLILPLLSLYFIAIMQRILPYGITEDRYLVFMLGVWLLIISLYIITSRIDNIIVIPVSLFLVLAISAFGPWGMFQLSVANQVMRLENLLKRNQMLKDGKLVSVPQDYSVSKPDASSIRSIFNYLSKRGEIGAIRRWLDVQDQAKLDSAIVHNDLVYIESFFSDLGPDDSMPAEAFQIAIADAHDLYKPLPIEGYRRIQYFHTLSPENQASNTDDTSTIVIGIEDQYFLTLAGRDTQIKVSLLPVLNNCRVHLQNADSLKRANQPTAQTLHVLNSEHQTIHLGSDSMRLDQGDIRILLHRIEYLEKGKATEIQLAEGFWLSR